MNTDVLPKPACAAFLTCLECDGAGEWDEGPLPATSSTQISPDYRNVKCPECKGTGQIEASE